MTIDSGVHHNFDRLEIKDLLEARETCHLHLLHPPNVVATAPTKITPISMDDLNEDSLDCRVCMQIVERPNANSIRNPAKMAHIS